MPKNGQFGRRIAKIDNFKYNERQVNYSYRGKTVMNKKYLSFLVPLFLCSLFLAIFAACGGNEKVFFFVNYFCEKGGSI